ncbi:MAG: homoserine dehydrogenase, partial [Candidatus Hydrogenedentes bacterium]|nr:homoserine dehydrogenase [Candidatus Hydrogenedentota bacterium]
AMDRGKHVVTANKKLIAMHGDTISRTATEHKVDFKFEASVAGGIPVIKALREGLVANDVKFIFGILNGTDNYILTRMTEENDTFDAALAEAQRLGFAESDPTLDIDGLDSAHKLQIIASLAFATWVPLDEIYVEGIRGLSAIDVQYATEMNYVIKLLAIVKQTENGAIDVRVHPTFIPTNYLLASVRHEFNAVYVRGDIVGTTLYYGKGAGRFPTASAVVADLVDIGRDMVAGTVGHIPPFTINDAVRVLQIEDVECSFYMRFTTADAPGVLGKIASILGAHNVSIDSAIQKSIPDGRTTAPIVLMTHKTRERDLRQAVQDIDRLDCVSEPTVVFRVE